MMPMQGDDIPDVEIQHVTFRSDGIWEFIYTERRHVTEDGCLVNTLVYDSKKLPQTDVNDVMETLLDLIDEGLLRLRNSDAAQDR